WICLKNGNEPSEECAARMVRAACGVKSRADLGLYPAEWNRLYGDFKASQRGETDEALEAMRR
ncbi:MAG: hypothetical protein ACR2RE_04535, partial [Geminicoccaceae bacterium]